ncbi:hypothetical protein BRD15_03665 [Halobacteriales archaeon SW_6_65_15]|nr:MAG: hypothetical protein BRD15_03665 [Halobacteriales archaeon SW_6_65_15]
MDRLDYPLSANDWTINPGAYWRDLVSRLKRARDGDRNGVRTAGGWGHEAVAMRLRSPLGFGSS